MLEAGSVYVTAGARFDDDGFRRWDRAVDGARRQARDDVEVPLKGDLDDRGFRRYRRELDTTERHTRGFAVGLRGSFGAVRGYAAGASAAATGSVALLGLKVLGTANDIGESLAKNGELFGRHADRIDRWSKTTADAFGVSRAQALEAAGAYGSLFETIGLADRPAANMSKRLVELAADLASFNNADPSETLDALRSGLIGEAEPMRRFGSLLSETRVQAEAWSSGIAKQGEELTEQEKVQARYQLILKDTKAAQGDNARTGDQLAGSWRRLKARASDVGAELGERLIPFADKAVDATSKLIGEWRKGEGTGGAIRRTLDRVGRAIGDVVGAVKDVVGWFREHKTATDVLISSLAGLAAGFVAVKIAAGFSAILTTLAKAIWAVNIAVRANPIGLLVTALIALGAGLVVAYKRSETFRRIVDGVFSTVKDLATSALDAYLGFVTGFLGGVQKIAEIAGKLPGVGDKFDAMAEAIGKAREDIDGFREGLRDGGREADRFDLSAVREENRKTAKSFRDLEKDANLDDVRKNVAANTKRIKERLSEDSAEGRAALARNFEKAQDAVRRQMRRGEVATRDGMKAIRGYLEDELQMYGFTLRQARIAARGRGADGQLNFDERDVGRRQFARGGWFGGRGQVGPDVIEFAPGMFAGAGEAMFTDGGQGFAIANRHQIPYVEQSLAITKALGLGPFGDLDELFAGVGRPHTFATGGQGIVPVPGFPGERANRSIIDRILGLVRRFPGLILTDAFGPGHKSPGHTVTGTAADFAGPDSVMDAAVRLLVGQGYLVGYDGRYGSQDWPGHGPAGGQGGRNAHLHVEFGSSGAGIRPPDLPRLGILGGGAVGRLAGRALELARAGAMGALEAASSASLAVPYPGGGARGGGGNRALGRRLLSAFGFGPDQWPPLDRLWTGESNWDHTARNPSSGAFGIPQSLPGSKMAAAGADWQTNPSTQIRWGLGYIRDRYGSPAAALRAWLGRSPHWYSRGGRGGRGGRYFNGGGTGSLTDAYAGDPGWNRGPYNIGKLARRVKDRIGAYEDPANDLERMSTNYEYWDRRYGASEEELIDPESGEVDQAAVQKRAGELRKLLAIRERMVARLAEARRAARRIVNTYKTILERLRASLDHRVKGKDRAGIRKQIKTYEGRLSGWRTELGDVGNQLRFARLDAGDVRRELASVLGTTAELEEPDRDTGDTDTDTGAGAVDERASALEADLAAARANLRAFASPGDIGAGGAVNAFGAAARDVFTRFGAGPGTYTGGLEGGLLPAGAPVVVVQPQVLIPGSAESLAAIGNAVAGAFDAQGYRSSNSEKVG
jgi:hypothetical protein